jgi:hypothetical protein
MRRCQCHAFPLHRRGRRAKRRWITFARPMRVRSDGKVSARLPDPSCPDRTAIFPPWADTFDGGRSSPITSPGSRQNPRPHYWIIAKIRANGAVRFFGENSPWYAFEVLRSNVSLAWPAQPGSSSGPLRRERPRPIGDACREAIAALWPRGIPGLRAKDRDSRIAHWLKLNNRSVPSGSGLARAVQRAMKRSSEAIATTATSGDINNPSPLVARDSGSNRAHHCRASLGFSPR